MQNSDRDLRAIVPWVKHLHSDLYMTDTICHEEEVEVWVSGENEDSRLCCVDSVVHKDAGGAEGSTVLPTSLVHYSYLTWTACGVQLMKL